MICEIPNVALWDAAGNCFNLDEPEELSKIHYAFFALLSFFLYFDKKEKWLWHTLPSNKISPSVSE